MIAYTSEISQMVVLLLCEAVAIIDARKVRSRLRLLYGLFLLSFFLGDLWWFLNMAIYEGNAAYSLIPYINWKAAMLFLILIMQQYHREPIFRKPISPLQLFIPVFCGGMCAFYMTNGAYLDNIVTAILMSIIIWNAVQRLIEIRKGMTKDKADSHLCRVILLFCLLEYGMWTASCLYNIPWVYDGLYYAFNFALSFCCILFIPAIRKAVDG